MFRYQRRNQNLQRYKDSAPAPQPEYCECGHRTASHAVGDFVMGACEEPGCECKKWEPSKEVTNESFD